MQRGGVLTVLALGVVGLCVVAVGAGAAAGVDDGTAPDCSSVSYPGNGTVQNPYEVATVDQLQCLAANNRTAVSEQVTDIDATGTDRWNNGSGFTPIEPPDPDLSAFSGAFHGKRHQIIGLSITRPTTQYVGLFNELSSDSVSTGVVLTDANITGREYVGGIAYRNHGEIKNVSVDESFRAEDDFEVGGIVGVNHGLIANSSATGRVSGPSAGGIAGTNIITGVIRQSEAHVRVRSDGEAGGLAGGSFSGDILNSHATGRVTGSTAVGGLTGNIGEDSVVKGSHATGPVEGDTDVGGLIGQVSGGTVTNSYATGGSTGMKR